MRRRRGLAAVGLCLMLLLAGCSFLPGSDDGGGGETADPPGVEDGQLADSEALLDAHVEALTESGYSHDLTVNQSRGETDITERQRLRVGPGASPYQRQFIYQGQFSARIVAWGNETVEYQRVESGGSTQYRRSSPDSAEAMAGANVIEPHLSAPLEVVDRGEVDLGEGENRSVVTLEATDRPTDDAAFPRNATSVERYDARLVVDDEGRILAMAVSAAFETEEGPGEYELTFEVTSLSDPGVERPEWVDEAESGE